MSDLISALKNQQLIWQGGNKTFLNTVLPTTYSELDKQLDGGFQTGVIEIRSMAGVGELRLLLPVLQAMAQQRLLVFIAAKGLVSAQALLACGIPLHKVLVLKPKSQQEALWAAEQCLHSGACHGVLMWADKALEIHQIKRLQVACHTGRCLHFILRTKRAESLSLPLDLSLSLAPHAQGLIATINKRKHGWPSEPFLINMAEQWPQLSVAKLANNIVQFPHRYVG